MYMLRDHYYIPATTCGIPSNNFQARQRARNSEKFLTMVVLILAIFFNHVYETFFDPDYIPADGFLVWGENCRIPNIRVLHDSIIDIVEDESEEILCSEPGKGALTELKRDEKSGRTAIQIADSALKNYSVSRDELECYYRPISRRYVLSQAYGNDNSFQLGEPVYFSNPSILPRDVEFLFVQCKAEKSTKRAFINYTTLHSVVVDKEPHYSSVSNEGDEERMKYNVMLFGIDSVSRLNFIRSMPQTKAYLEKQNWTWLEGYNKVADNTIMNLVPVLTGMDINQYSNYCLPSNGAPADGCPFIWKEYSKKGYLTAYFEDWPDISTFNYLKFGFLNKPTDYYGRPYLITGKRMVGKKEDSYCMGPRAQADYVSEFAIEFVKRMEEYKRAHFSLFWFNTFSHEDLNRPKLMDSYVRNIFKEMEAHLNNTFLFFFSDHGFRLGAILETKYGWFEVRLPFMYIWVPPVYRQEHPDKYANLVKNRNRLTTPFDLHATLKELLYGHEVKPPKGCPGCHSLFREVALNRSCEEAAISSQWCTCSADYEVKLSITDAPVSDVMKTILISINEYLSKHRGSTAVGSKCAFLSLSKVLDAKTRQRRITSNESVFEYYLLFETLPGKGRFEVTWNNGSPLGVEDINRVNRYGSQADCVLDNSELTKFCHCV